MVLEIKMAKLIHYQELGHLQNEILFKIILMIFLTKLSNIEIFVTIFKLKFRIQTHFLHVTAKYTNNYYEHGQS